MKTPKLHRTVGWLATAVAEHNRIWASEDAREEAWRAGWPASRIGQPLQVSLLRRALGPVGSFIAHEWGSWKGTRMLNLKQLHAELEASLFLGEKADAEGRALIALVARDLHDAELWPIPDCGPGSARPLSEWRAHYGGIERYLRYVG